MKKTVKVVLWALLILILGFTAVMPKKSYVKSMKTEDYKALLTIWQIDSFEGGKGSRTAFLRSISLGFTKQNKGVLTLVIPHTVKSAQKAISEGKIPDIISVGACGLDFSAYQKEMGSFSVEGGGTLNGKRYFTAWARGGYFKLSKGNGESLIAYENDYNSSLIALALSSCVANNLKIMEREEALQAFIRGKNVSLIGTHRDVVRLQNRGVEFEFDVLSEFCDLYQYALITSKDNEYYSRLFVNYLLTDGVQNKLVDISMLSTVKGGLYSDNEPFSRLERQAVKYTVSPFIDESAIKNLYALAKEVLNGQKSKEELIKHL